MESAAPGGASGFPRPGVSRMWWQIRPLQLATMTKLSLRLPDDVHAEAQRCAERDGVSLNEWLVAAVDRETVRRKLEALNEWGRSNPPDLDQWEARQRDLADAEREAQRRRGAA